VLPFQLWAQVPAPDGVDVMLLIDNSGSMQRSDPQQWRFSAAKNIAYSLLDHGIGTGQQDRLWVIEFADSPSTLISGLSLSDTESIEQARAEIAKSIKPSPGATPTYMPR
jgi:Mg-chelatase subunit ChlD